MKNKTKSAAVRQVSATVQKAKKTRVALYQQHFTPTVEVPQPDGFIPQVNGFGTPLFAQVSSFSGI